MKLIIYILDHGKTQPGCTLICQKGDVPVPIAHFLDTGFFEDNGLVNAAGDWMDILADILIGLPLYAFQNACPMPEVSIRIAARSFHRPARYSMITWQEIVCACIDRGLSIEIHLNRVEIPKEFQTIF